MAEQNVDSADDKSSSESSAEPSTIQQRSKEILHETKPSEDLSIKSSEPKIEEVVPPPEKRGEASKQPSSETLEPNKDLKQRPPDRNR